MDSRFRGNDGRRRFRSGFLLLLAFVVASPAFAANPAPTAELIALVKKAVSESTSFKDRFAAQVWLMD
ncbi:MAG TPA: hypothetical protein VFK45_11680, partial [Gammaproteobacteria bacterium]|nr:hypothetical protein [Gammaproteobacteria bacterium]